MKLIAAIAAVCATTGVAHAEKFDLVCATKLKVEMKGRPTSTIDQEMAYTLDTEALTIQRHGPDGPVPLEISASQYSFKIGPGVWIIDRNTNRISTSAKSSTSTMTLTGDCVKQPSASE